MIDWLKKIFTKAPPPRLPQPGEIWFFLEKDDSPWPIEQEPRYVKILDQRDGWVRYDMGGSIFRDERIEISTFIDVYRPKDEK